jgi:hypothetical protein
MASLRLRILRLFVGLPALVLVLLPACKPASGPPAASSGEKPHTESDLSRTTLTDEQARSLVIRTDTPRLKEVQEQVRLTGWVMAPPGRDVTLTARTAGIVRALPAHRWFEKSRPPVLLYPGQTVRQEQALLILAPTLTAMESVQRNVLRAEIETDIAKAGRASPRRKRRSNAWMSRLPAWSSAPTPSSSSTPGPPSLTLFRTWARRRGNCNSSSRRPLPLRRR